MALPYSKKSLKQIVISTFSALAGAFLAAFALEVVLLPNNIIDGGVIGVAILLGKLFGSHLVYPLVCALNVPFIVLAVRHLSKSLVIRMLFSVLAFSFFGWFIGISDFSLFEHYRGELLEIVVVGGLLLGLGVGLIIRAGGCLDGTEILGIMLSKRWGVTVGSIVLMINAVIFVSAGVIFGQWRTTIQSLITFFVVIKIMDMVIVGLDEKKSVMIISTRPKEIAEAMLHQLGLGLTIIDARGGFSGDKRDILYLIAERLQLVSIKNIVLELDPLAVVAIENLHEVASGQMSRVTFKKPTASKKKMRRS